MTKQTSKPGAIEKVKLSGVPDVVVSGGKVEPLPESAGGWNRDRLRFDKAKAEEVQ